MRGYLRSTKILLKISWVNLSRREGNREVALLIHFLYTQSPGSQGRVNRHDGHGCRVFHCDWPR